MLKIGENPGICNRKAAPIYIFGRLFANDCVADVISSFLFGENDLYPITSTGGAA
jgi:hypothetical protein